MIRDNLRTIIFGVEDSFVSTTGVIVGLIAAGTEMSTVLVAAIITIVVEATSMGAGEFISNDENPDKDKKAIHKGLVMLVSYSIAGVWILVPLLLGADDNWIILSFTFASLFALGWWRGSVLKGSKLKYAVRTVLISGAACAVGVGAGLILR